MSQTDLAQHSSVIVIPRGSAGGVEDLSTKVRGHCAANLHRYGFFCRKNTKIRDKTAGKRQKGSL